MICVIFELGRLLLISIRGNMVAMQLKRIFIYLVGSVAGALGAFGEQRPNILFIAVDDLRPRTAGRSQSDLIDIFNVIHF